MAVLSFIVNDIFGQGAIFIALIAMIGLILQKKPFGEIVRGTAMTAIGFFHSDNRNGDHHRKVNRWHFCCIQCDYASGCSFDNGGYQR